MANINKSYSWDRYTAYMYKNVVTPRTSSRQKRETSSIFSDKNIGVNESEQSWMKVGKWFDLGDGV